MLVGGTFPMGRGASDDCPTSMSCGTLDQPEHSATVTGYYLDAFEVTVGRFRKFYLQYGGPFVSPGAGAHAGIANSGWDSSWNNSSYLPDNSTTLLTSIINCTNSSWPVATDPNPPDPEQRPVNCVTWYEAFAFCVYDGGRLPTEAEWELAAAGGSANLFYPWGNYSSATLPANYSVNLHSAKVSVGSAPGGVGLFGQLDLIGSVNEWILDGIGTAWYSPGSNGNPCTDCADLLSSDVTFRGLRGGAWSSSNLATLRSAARKSDDPAALSANYGIRCAHDKTQ
jgi:formylglycine-generating enzyme required for sulfatase activity